MYSNSDYWLGDALGEKTSINSGMNTLFVNKNTGLKLNAPDNILVTDSSVALESEQLERTPS